MSDEGWAIERRRQRLTRSKNTTVEVGVEEVDEEAEVALGEKGGLEQHHLLLERSLFGDDNLGAVGALDLGRVRDEERDGKSDTLDGDEDQLSRGEERQSGSLMRE